MFARKTDEDKAKQDEQDLEETRRRQARVLAQLAVLTRAVEDMVVPRKEADGHRPTN